jgi:uncharacterized protein (TIGR02328 family)
MRLWHKDIIKFLPKSQLIAQWRELNSIYAKQNNHILINYIYKYPKSYLYTYSQIVINEMKKRGYKINKWDNYNNYFEDCVKDIWINEYINELAFDEHNEEYFMICYYNLMEKHLRGQKDFSNEIWNEIVKLKEKLYEKEI